MQEIISQTAKPQKVLFGVGTNLLFDAVSRVNVSLDIPVGKHWDITADYVFPWWRLTAELGVGPVFSQYRIYNAEAPDRLVVQEDTRNVFLRPTQAKFSLTYLLHTPVRTR